MKKIILVFIFSNFLMSELVLEITQGAEDPYRVALIPFNGEKNISRKEKKYFLIK